MPTNHQEYNGKKSGVFLANKSGLRSRMSEKVWFSQVEDGKKSEKICFSGINKEERFLGVVALPQQDLRKTSKES